MCGIVAVFKNAHGASPEDVRAAVVAMSTRQRHRGPDSGGVYMHVTPALITVLAHERLAIVGTTSGSQPFVGDGVSVTVNGEIYNHLALKQELGMPPEGSDCAVLIPMYKKYGPAFVERLDGMFAFVLYDSVTHAYLVARDHMGKVPLYSQYTDTQHAFASELKAFSQDMSEIQVFPPGHYYWSKDDHTTQWYAPAWFTTDVIPSRDVSGAELRSALEAAVKKRLMADVSWGVLLSGGLDSSLVAAIACKLVLHPKHVHTFAIGLENSPDLAAAQRVADYLGTTHHAFQFTVQEGLDALKDVVYHIETYDVTTTRASTPMYLMARKIKALNIKMVLSGEGSDELFGGYLYFHKAPDPAAFFQETVQKLKHLHLYDCLRANKSMAAWGVECRTPFLDRAFMDLVMAMDPRKKMCGKNGGNRMEKHVLRAAFEGYLPPDVLWRQKEQFSDGVGYSWIDGLKARAKTYAVQHVPSAINPPLTDEGRMIRDAFDAHFRDAAGTVPGGPSVACSTSAAMAWDAAFQKLAKSGGECSGRAVDVHASALK